MPLAHEVPSFAVVKHSKTLQSQCVTLMGGDLPVGVLLAQVIYWYLPTKAGRSKLTGKPKLGHHWVARTRDQWMADTDLTLDRYKRAIRVLREKGIIEVRQMKFAGLNVSHLRLLVPYKFLLSGGFTPTLRVAGLAPLLQWRDSPHSNTSITDRDYGQRSCADASSKTTGTVVGSDRQEETQREDAIEDLIAPEEEPAMKAEEIIKQKKSAQAGTLAAFWQKRCALILGGYQKPLTGKELGQLKQLQTYLGPRAREVIDYALEHWWKFASEAGAGAGTPFPSDPHLGFLLKHHAVAVNLLQPIAPIPVAPHPYHEETPTVPEKPYQLSQQELDEMLEGLKE